MSEELSLSFEERELVYELRSPDCLLRRAWHISRILVVTFANMEDSFAEREAFEWLAGQQSECLEILDRTLQESGLSTVLRDRSRKMGKEGILR